MEKAIELELLVMGGAKTVARLKHKTIGRNRPDSVKLAIHCFIIKILGGGVFGLIIGTFLHPSLSYD
jgi:hypothetical protein